MAPGSVLRQAGASVSELQGLIWVQAGAPAHGEGKPGGSVTSAWVPCLQTLLEKMGRGDSRSVTFPISVWIRWLVRERQGGEGGMLCCLAFPSFSHFLSICQKSHTDSDHRWLVGVTVT